MENIKNWFKGLNNVHKVLMCFIGMCILVFLCVFVVWLSNFIKTQKVLSDYAVGEEIVLGTVVDELQEDDADYLNIDLGQYINKNEDTVGYLDIMGLNIQYAVTQSSDNDFYLRRDFEKKDSAAGWIYADYRSDLEYLGQNTVIYGHNMKSGTMFGNLKQLKNKINEPNGRYIRLQTKQGSYIFEVVSMYVSDTNFNFVQSYFEEEEFDTFVEEVKERNTLEAVKDVEFDSTDSLLTLVTCSGVEDRLVVHAKLINAKFLN